MINFIKETGLMAFWTRFYVDRFQHVFISTLNWRFFLYPRSISRGFFLSPRMFLFFFWFSYRSSLEYFISIDYATDSILNAVHFYYHLKRQNKAKKKYVFQIEFNRACLVKTQPVCLAHEVSLCRDYYGFFFRLVKLVLVDFHLYFHDDSAKRWACVEERLAPKAL